MAVICQRLVHCLPEWSGWIATIREVVAGGGWGEDLEESEGARLMIMFFLTIILFNDLLEESYSELKL